DRECGEKAMQGIHRHAVVGGTVGKQELVEFGEFLVGKGLVEMHGGIREGGEGRQCTSRRRQRTAGLAGMWSSATGTMRIDISLWVIADFGGHHRQSGMSR